MKKHCGISQNYWSDKNRREKPCFETSGRRKIRSARRRRSSSCGRPARGILAVNGREGYPYAIPINYYYDREAQKIYFHGAVPGHKAEAIRACDKVCFTVYGSETIREEAWAPYLRSVVVFGRCRLLEQSPETMALLKRFAMKYYPEERLADEEIRQDGAAAQLFEIEIHHLSGKEVQEK